MQFNSISFLIYFLPIMLAVYRLVPQKLRSAVLTAGSLLFYWLAVGGDVLSVSVIVSLTVASYLVLRQACRSGGHAVCRCLTATVVSVLVFFKCYAGGRFMPAGLSFFTFQLLAYSIEAGRGETRLVGGFTDFAANMTMFPKLLAGPIAEPEALERRCARPAMGLAVFHTGLRELILGLSLKVCLADRIGGLWSAAGIMGYDSLSPAFAWCALISFTLRLYFDFWGYSVMAIGLGHMLGYSLPENFLEPYSAISVSDFYRRWHASLGQWFKKYIYIPLGGNRCGMGRTIFNLSVVWLLTGLWHGMTLNFLIWAGILLFFIVNERLWLGKILKKHRLVGHIYTPLVIVLSWAAFAITDIGDLAVFYRHLFGVGSWLDDLGALRSWGGDYMPLLAVGVLFVTPLPRRLWRRISRSAWADVIIFLLFWLCVCLIATSSSDPFMYFDF